MINTETEAEEGRQRLAGISRRLGQHGASIAQALPLTANIPGLQPSVYRTPAQRGVAMGEDRRLLAAHNGLA